MTEQAFDLTEAIYSIGDSAADPAQAAAQLEALAVRLRGGQAPAPELGPGGQSSVQPEMVPAAPAEPVGIAQLPRLVDDAARKAAVMGEQDQRDALWTLAETVNASLDANAREQSPHLYPKPPADNDEELAALAGRINQASLDPGGVTETDALALAEELNATIGGISDAHLRRVDDFEQRRVHAQRAREAKARQQDTAARDLRALANRLDGAAAPGR